MSAARRRRASGRQRVFRGNQEIGVGAAVRAAHAPAKLVEVGQAEAVGVVDDHGVGAWDVQAVFDERGGHQHVVFTLHELQHDALEFLLAHLAVRHADARGGHQPLEERGDG